MTKIDIDILKERINYNTETGEFFHTKLAKPAGYVSPDGYLIIMLDGRSYRATHIAHAIVEGSWPEHTMDHKDRNPQNIET